MLRPHRALTIDVGGCSAFMGPMARYLGQILATSGRLDEAVVALDEAIERAQSSGSAPWATLARRDLVQALRRRGAPGDSTRARELEVTAAREARLLGMGDLSSRSRPSAR